MSERLSDFWLADWFVPEASAVMRRVRELDPLQPMHHAISAQLAYQARDPATAVEHARRAVALNPTFWIGYAQQAQALHSMGPSEVALEALAKASQFSGNHVPLIGLRGHILATLKRLDEARATIDTLNSISATRYVPPTAIAIVYAGLKDPERTFEWLERAYDTRDVNLILLPVDPRWDPYRADPRSRATTAPLAYRSLAFMALPLSIVAHRHRHQLWTNGTSANDASRREVGVWGWSQLYAGDSNLRIVRTGVQASAQRNTMSITLNDPTNSPARPEWTSSWSPAHCRRPQYRFRQTPVRGRRRRGIRNEKPLRSRLACCEERQPPKSLNRGGRVRKLPTRPQLVRAPLMPCGARLRSCRLVSARVTFRVTSRQQHPKAVVNGRKNRKKLEHCKRLVSGTLFRIRPSFADLSMRIRGLYSLRQF